MKRITVVSSLVVAALSLSIALSSLERNAALPVLLADEGGATISDFMIAVHKGKTSLMGQITASLKEPGPANDKAWKAVKARALVSASLVDSILANQTPQKGEKSSWDGLVAKHGMQFKKLAAAAESQDLSAATAEAKSLKRSCGGCHKPHK